MENSVYIRRSGFGSNFILVSFLYERLEINPIDRLSKPMELNRPT